MLACFADDVDVVVCSVAFPLEEWLMRDSLSKWQLVRLAAAEAVSTVPSARVKRPLKGADRTRLMRC